VLASVGRVGGLGAGLIKKLGAAAAAVIYLIKHTFTHANQSLDGLDQIGGESGTDYTNEYLQNRALGTSPNTLSNATAPKDATGYDGQANSAHTLNDANGGVAGYVGQTFTGLSGDIYWADWYVKADTDETRFPAIRISASSVSTRTSVIHLNTKTGALGAEGINDGAIATDMGNGWWRLSVPVDNSGGNANLDIRFYPARGTTLGTYDPAATGSVVCDFLGMYTQTALPTAPPLETDAGTSTCYYSTDAGDIGNLQITEGSNSSVAITSNQLVWTQSGASSETPPAASAVALTPTTLANGMGFKATTKVSAQDTATYAQILLTDAPDSENASRLMLLRHYGTSSYTNFSFNPAGTVNESFVTAGPTAANTDQQLAMVWDDTDNQWFCYYNDNSGGWTLQSVVPQGAALTTVYPDISCGLLGGGSHTATFDNFNNPNSATDLSGVFTPTDYAMALFSGTTTALTSYTSDSGHSFEAYGGVIGTMKTDGSGRAVHNSANATWRLITARFKTGSVSVLDTGIAFRSVDASNAFVVSIDDADSALFSVQSVVSGTPAQNAGTVITAAATLTEYDIQVRDDGANRVEGWLDGGNKVEYTSLTLFPTATKVAILGRNATGGWWDNLYVRPLTSGDYDTELDAI
jgi:hypothetical protein